MSYVIVGIIGFMLGGIMGILVTSLMVANSHMDDRRKERE